MNNVVVTQWISPGLCRNLDAAKALKKATMIYRKDRRHSQVIQGLMPKVSIGSGLYYSLWEQRLIQGVSIKLTPKISAMAVQRAFKATEAGMELMDCIVE